VVPQGHAPASAFRDSAVLNMAGVEHQQPIAAHAVKMDALAPAHRYSETGRNAPRTPSAEMDAAAVCTPAVC
jgi:hypothetical protein